MVDVVDARQDLTAHNVDVVDVGLSNYSALPLLFASRRSSIETFVRRPWRSLDINDFRSGLLSVYLMVGRAPTQTGPDMMGSLYDTELNAIPARLYSHPPPMHSQRFVHFSIVDFSQFSMPQPS